MDSLFYLEMSINTRLRVTHHHHTHQFKLYENTRGSRKPKLKYRARNW